MLYTYGLNCFTHLYHSLLFVSTFGIGIIVVYAVSLGECGYVLLKPSEAIIISYEPTINLVWLRSSKTIFKHNLVEQTKTV